MNAPATERQVLYALVAGAWMLVTAVLAGVAAGLGLSPTWWSAVFAIGWLAAATHGIRHWRRTPRLLLLSLVVFVAWTVGTLITR